MDRQLVLCLICVLTRALNNNPGIMHVSQGFLLSEHFPALSAFHLIWQLLLYHFA
jgi:hypothetical protein